LAIKELENQITSICILRNSKQSFFATVVARSSFGTQWSISGKGNQQSTVRWQMCW